MPPRILRLILGDQLNSLHTWFSEVNPNIEYVLMEMEQELNYTTHHIQKICAFFLAMRNFKEEREKEGHSFTYLTLEDPKNTHDLPKNLSIVLSEGGFTKFEYQFPDEYRLDQQLLNFCSQLMEEGLIETKSYSTEHFFTDRFELIERFGKRKTYTMETFYRQMRKDHDILMIGKDPEGGEWNFDADNRKPYDYKIPIPDYIVFNRSAKEIHNMLDRKQIQYIGNIENDVLPWPISRKEGLKALHFFAEKLLPYFGSFEDAMDTHQTALFHSRLSFALNIKLLSPFEVIHVAISSFRKSKGNISISQIEGFVRQIVGWREFMRCQYWANMPAFSTLNYFHHHRDLPKWYWTGETKMNCLHHAVKQSLDLAYAHHIQRLMITGSFALLTGTHPDQVDNWYLGIYIDAIEWVEITNTRGMSQFADGGIIGTKPYVSGANYISKMSNYCTKCYYDPKKRHGEKACPFNSLYWNFFLERKDQLYKNQRVSLVYRNLEKMNDFEIQDIQNQANEYLDNINDL